MATAKRVTVKQVAEELSGFKEVFEKFISNDFKHMKEEIVSFRKRIDRLIALTITALISTALMLLGLVANLVLTIAKG